MRPDRLNPLFADVDGLEGVGLKLRKPLEKLGLTRVRDVIYHLPDRFVQRRAVGDPPAPPGSGTGSSWARPRRATPPASPRPARAETGSSPMASPPA